MKVLRDARLTECCGQHYCDSCLKKWLGVDRSCPQCRKKVFQSILNKAMIREINEFKVHCNNKTKGCKWVGELGTLKDHLESDNGCDYVMVTCSNAVYNVMQIRRSTLTNCGEGMERRLLADHQKNQCLYRQYTCQYCGYIDTYDAITGSGMIKNEGSMIMYGGNHYKQCIEYPLDCPNECGAENIKRNDMEEHKEICPLEAIVCPFSEFCNEDDIILRKDIEDHKKECDFRPYQCEHCGHNGTYLSVSGEGQFWTLSGPNHYDQCEQYPLQCPNECGAENIKRNDMEEHKEICPLEAIVCPFSEFCNEDDIILRKDIEDHKRECDFHPYQCEHCGHNGTYLSMSGEGQFWTLSGPNHYDQCEQYPLQCPNECGAENIKRKDMKIHREICPLEAVVCPFQQVGCPVGKILCKDVDTHCKENMQPHLLLVVQSNKELAHKVVELSRKNEELNEEIAHKNEEFEERIQVLEAHQD